MDIFSWSLPFVAEKSKDDIFKFLVDVFFNLVNEIMFNMMKQSLEDQDENLDGDEDDEESHGKNSINEGDCEINTEYNKRVIKKDNK